MRGAGLALRAMPVAAAVVGDLAVPAVAAAFDMPAQGRRSAAANRPHDLELATAQMPGIILGVGVTVTAEDIRHLQQSERLPLTINVRRPTGDVPYEGGTTIKLKRSSGLSVAPIVWAATRV